MSLSESRVLGATATATDDLDEVRRELEVVNRELAQRGRRARADEHADAIEQLRARFRRRFDSIASAHGAAAALRRIGSPQEVLSQTPRALTAGTTFERVIVSTLHEGVLIPTTVHFQAAAVAASAGHETDTCAAEEMLERLRASPVKLERHIIESDVIRRRRATLVTNVKVNPRVDRHLASLLGWDCYVVAPVMHGAVVIAMIHADRGLGRPVDTLDRDMLGEFAAVVSQISESAELRRTLRRERETLRHFVDWVNALSASLAETPATLGSYARREDCAAPTPAPLGIATDEAGGDGQLVLSGLLTRRELDVLRLLAEGGTNRTIADALVVSETTVKFHVTSIRRKLRVANRAEAVARYLSLLGMPLPR